MRSRARAPPRRSSASSATSRWATSRRPSERLRERTRDDITTLDEFREFFSGDDTDSGGFVKAPWSEDPATLETMGELGVSVRCIPFDEELPPDARCVITGGPATGVAIFAKAY